MPDTVARTVQCTVKFTYKPSATAGLAFTPQDVLVNVPGNVPSAQAGTPTIYWKFIRLVKVSVWDLGSGSGSAAPLAQVSFPNEPRILSDYGVQGAESAAVHARPPLQTLQRWFPTTDATTKLFSAVTSSSSAQGLIYVTAELLSDSTVPS